ncbi:hypothetical protein [Sporolactobacillus terrae]|uniref:hypothetical protein n=1 Tax=Sporolactobacillus terrae TaxID=269673 RepID=UPI0012DE8B14|nr:hypothetical protein [Sporolactobacillus terrae]
MAGKTTGGTQNVEMPDVRKTAAYYYDLDDLNATVKLYFQPLSRFYHQNLQQLARVADFLSEQADFPVSRLMVNRYGSYETKMNGRSWVLMSRPEIDPRWQRRSSAELLSELHARTIGANLQAFPESPAASRGELLGRLDALQGFYERCRSEEDPSSFERTFIELFPYFACCAENAVQMYADDAIDYPNQEQLCVGHYRYSIDEQEMTEDPSQWVIDDRSRDLAEAMRLFAWRSAGDADVAANAFLDAYESRFPLTEPVIEKMVGRLLYPLAFIECCERYFANQGDDQRTLELQLRRCGEKIKERERVLKGVIDRYGGRVSAPEWLMRP